MSAISSNKIQKSYIHLLQLNPWVNYIDISLTKPMFLKTFNSEVSYIEIWFTDEILNPLEIENKLKISLNLK